MDSGSTSSELRSEAGFITDSELQEVDLELSASTANTLEVEVPIQQSLVEELPAIVACQAPTMDIVTTVPLCGQLISGTHASPLGVTANQTAPLLVEGPSFSPVMQGLISMLLGVSISLLGTPGMQIAPPAAYSSIQSISAPPPAP